jgi:hypothetical protein
VIVCLKNLFPVLKKIDLSNVMIAGGSLTTIIQSLSQGSGSPDQRKINDVDLFIFGLSKSRMMERLEKLVDDIVNYYPKAHLLRTEGSVSLFDQKKQVKFQIVLRWYETPSQILHGFDLGSCMIGLHENQLFTCAMGKFCLERRVNIVRPECCSSTFEIRMNKYLDRGFSLVLPNLNMEKIHGPVSLGTLRFRGEKTGNALIILEVIPLFSIGRDYDVNFVDLNHYFDPREIARRFILSRVLPSMYSYQSATLVRRSDFQTGKEGIEKSLFPIRARFMESLWISHDPKELQEISDEYEIEYNRFTNLVWREDTPGKRISGAFFSMAMDEKKWYGEFYLKEPQSLVNCPHCGKSLMLQ